MKIISTLKKEAQEGTGTVSDLISGAPFVGWIYSINFDRALLLTNDLWKFNAKGIPHNCFLLAATFDPQRFNEVNELDREVILLRVVGPTKLPQDDDLVRSRIDYYQQQKEIHQERGLDPITFGQMQFGGLECRVLGTFYYVGNELHLGSDLESFPSASRLKTFRPVGDALDRIVNYIDPIRRRKAHEELAELGVLGTPTPFKIGTVRYTSTTRLHGPTAEKIPVCLQPSDFLARRTAVLGMTRTGKSNMIKQLVSVVHQTSAEGGLPIGQIIFDVNGEYANANKQDQGSIADAFPDNTVRYRLLDTPGFLPLKNNFYEQLNDGYQLLAELLQEKNNASGDLSVFMSLSFDQPEEGDWGEIGKFNIRKAAYWGLLSKAGFRSNARLRTKFKANKGIVEAVNSELEAPLDPSVGLTPQECSQWFSALRRKWKEESAPPKKRGRASAGDDSDLEAEESKGDSGIEKWLSSNHDVRAMMNMLEGKNEKDSYILGYRLLIDLAKFHTPDRTDEVGQEIYTKLKQGKVVILDLSVGKPSLRERLTRKIAEKIFGLSMEAFIAGTSPPNIVMYIEEAHNLIGKDADPDTTWPRIAKEGAKYRIALVYATQEVSSMHANILANTENWFITHLNNSKEVGELSKFYDFSDFSDSLIRSQDVGFARVKTLSGPFVVPVQIDRFDPPKKKGK